jgi:LysM repeat protein
VLALLVLAAVVAVVALVGVGGGGDSGTDSAARSRSPATTEPPRTTTTTTRAPFTYTVQRGDVLSALARVFGVSTTAIVEANPNLDPDHLVEGQTFIVPSPIPLSLVVRPRKVLVGGSIDLTLKGAQEAETVVFEIDRPTGPFLGQAHTATTKGAVSASYELGIADPPGTYTVIARGDAGTVAQTTFVVQAR